ncbi:hypothetical protein E2C01_014734 [Portunus trituberculatus]|uniref:Uncharacterized protein n=1 Tax=Portunus trituberculatus TaxID=210409 RepID=A0A5B7DL02_PORTR|nr:hypothetical protein [Portunus trituberculatus]
MLHCLATSAFTRSLLPHGLENEDYETATRCLSATPLFHRGGDGRLGPRLSRPRCNPIRLLRKEQEEENTQHAHRVRLVHPYWESGSEPHRASRDEAQDPELCQGKPGVPPHLDSLLSRILRKDQE